MSISCGDTRAAAGLVRATGHATRLTWLFGSPASGATALTESPPPIEVVLDPGARIEGRVLAAPEGAVVRAVVAGTSLLDGERFRESAWTPPSNYAFVVTPDSDGAFAIDGLPTFAPVRVELAMQDRAVTCLPDPLVLGPGETGRVEWDAGAGVDLELAVRDEHGAPVPGAQVHLLWPSFGGFEPPWDARWTARSDGAGRVVFEGVPVGRWTAELEAADARTRRTRGVDWPEARVSIEVGPETGIVSLTAFEPRRISGLVVGPDDERVATEIHVTRMEAGVPSNTYSICKGDEAGRFESGPLAPGTYRLSAGPTPPWDTPFARSEAAFVEAGADDVRLTLRRGRVIQLRALSNDGPVAARFSVGRIGAETGPRIVTRGRRDCLLWGVVAGEYVALAVTADGLVGMARFSTNDLDHAAPRPGIDVEVEEGGALRVRWGSLPREVDCQLWFADAFVERLYAMPGGVERMMLPPGRGVVSWRLARPGSRGDGAAAEWSHRTFEIVRGRETTVEIVRQEGR